MATDRMCWIALCLIWGNLFVHQCVLGDLGSREPGSTSPEGHQGRHIFGLWLVLPAVGHMSLAWVWQSVLSSRCGFRWCTHNSTDRGLLSMSVFF